MAGEDAEKKMERKRGCRRTVMVDSKETENDESDLRK